MLKYLAAGPEIKNWEITEFLRTSGDARLGLKWVTSFRGTGCVV